MPISRGIATTSRGKKATGNVVRLPYFLVPGLDLTSRAYQKATSLGSSFTSTVLGRHQKTSNEIMMPVTLFPDQALQVTGKSLISFHHFALLISIFS